MAQTMRVPSALEQIRTLEDELDGPDQAARLRAARRIHEIGIANRPNSRARDMAIDTLARRLTQEPAGRMRRLLEEMLGELRGEERAEHTEHGTVPHRNLGMAVPARRGQQTTMQREEDPQEPRESTAGILLRRAAEAALGRILWPLSFAVLSGCGGTWQYEGSLMSRETHLVREFTEELTREDTTVAERVRSIVRWGQTNLPHYGEGYYAEVYGEEVSDRGAAYPEDVSIRDVFRERVVGCHLAAFTLITMMRSIGIQADYVRSEDFAGISEEGHGIIHVPELDSYIHGDDVCLGNVWPTELIITDRDSLIALHNPNTPDSELREAFLSGIHSFGQLRRDGDALYISNGFIHSGYEEPELARLRAMFPDFDITLDGPHEWGAGTAFRTRRVPIQPLE